MSLLLEAGPDYPDLDEMPDDVKYGYGHGKSAIDVLGTEHRWHFVAKSTDQAPPMLVPRGKTTGGSSAVNAQIFLRGVPEDYDDWASWGNDEWSFQKLIPFFRRMETDTDFSDDFHGVDGPTIIRRYKPDEWLPDQQAWYHERAANTASLTARTITIPDSTGAGPCPFNNPNRIRWSTNIGYLSEARDRPNLTIVSRALAHRIIFDGARATGVEYEADGEMQSANGDEVILSAGAIGSPHLLMLSGVGPAEHLQSMGIGVVHDSPGVGKNLRDHPQVQLTWKTKPGFEQDSLAPRIQFVLRYTAAGSTLRNDMLIHPFSYATRSLYYTDPNVEPIGIGMIAAIYLAESAGEILLRTTSPRIQPFLDYNLLATEFDRNRMRESVHICLDLAKKDSLADLIEDRRFPTDADLASDQTLDDWMMRNVRTSHHISGTCKMGPADDAMAVVDQYARMHGIEGLRVADASVMPDCIRANTNATSMVIGERVAEFIRDGR